MSSMGLVAFFEGKRFQRQEKKYTKYQWLTYFVWRNYGPAGPADAGPGSRVAHFQAWKIKNNYVA